MNWTAPPTLTRPRHGTRPATFAERGCVVPFRAPALLAARAREDERHGLVLLLRDFAQNGSVFVLPWNDVPEIVSPGTFDRVLHRTIAEGGRVSPPMVSAAVRRSETLARPQEAAAATALGRRRDDELRAALLRVLLHALGIDAGRLRGEANPGLADPLRVAAARLGVAGAELPARLETISETLLPVGLADPAGPLRRLGSELADFARHLRRRIDGAPAEAQPHYRRMMKAVGETLGLAQPLIVSLDAGLQPASADLPAWLADPGRLAATIGRLWWLLDGWEQVLDRYAVYLEARDQRSEEQELALIAALAPVVPESELRVRAAPA